MIRSLSKNIVKYVANDNYTKDEKEQMEYVLNTFFFESIKMLMSIIIFSILGYFKEVVIITVIMISVKPFIGGYHEDTQLKCFIATMLLTTGELILYFQCPLNFWTNLMLMGISIFCIYNQAPVINPKMPITRPQIIKKNRRIGLVNVIIIGLIAVIFYNYNIYSSLMTWTILIIAILMFNKRTNLKF